MSLLVPFEYEFFRNGFIAAIGDLDEATAALERLVEYTGWSVFA